MPSLQRAVLSAFVVAMVLIPSASAVPPTVSVTLSGTAGAGGWFRGAVTVKWTVSGETSSAGCDTTTISTEGVSPPITCNAVNAADTPPSPASASVTVKIDVTPPSVTGANFSRGADAGGWYNHPVDIAFTGTDSLSGLASCSGATYSGPDAGGTSISGTCTDVAGNSASGTVSLKYDATPPQLSGGAPDRPPDGNGWYNHPVTVKFAGTDGGSGIGACTSATYSGPDTPGVSVSGSCSDNAGNASGAGTVAIKYDATPPQVTGATPDRKPDAHGWYNHPVTLTFAGTDGGSGLASCTKTTYSGPDNRTAAVSGTCVDQAGNTSQPRGVTIPYDATPPKVGNVSAKVAGEDALLRWKASADTARIDVVRMRAGKKKGTTVYRGRGSSFQDRGLRSGIRYRYAVVAYDRAENAAMKTLAVAARLGLLAPKEGARLSSPPLLSWTAVRGAPFFNLQLYRLKGKKREKVLSVFPMQPRYKLKKAWVFQGEKLRLEAGKYRWYLWPGKKGSGRHYGKLLGSREFVITR
jgi:hypothetical protein